MNKVRNIVALVMLVSYSLYYFHFTTWPSKMGAINKTILKKTGLNLGKIWSYFPDTDMGLSEAILDPKFYELGS